MKQSEFSHIIVAVLVLTLVSSFAFILEQQWNKILTILIFSAIIITLSISAKKLTAYLLDSNVEHEIWEMSRYGFAKRDYFKKPIPAGIIFPSVLAILSLGIIKFTSILTYETRALKYRASKRFGFYSFTEITDWHHALIGAAGIFSILLLSVVTYLIPTNLEYLAKISAYYAFWNLLPISKLDGAQIFFGSRVLWTILATITAIFVFLALTII